MESLNTAQAISAILQVRQGQDEAAKQLRTDTDFTVEGGPGRENRGEVAKGVQGAVVNGLDQTVTEMVEEFANAMRFRLEELNVDLNRRLTVKVDDRNIIRVVNQHPEKDRIEDGLNEDQPLKERFSQLAERVSGHAREHGSANSAFRRSGLAAYQAVTNEDSNVSLTLEEDSAWVGLDNA